MGDQPSGPNAGAGVCVLGTGQQQQMGLEAWWKVQGAHGLQTPGKIKVCGVMVGADFSVAKRTHQGTKLNPEQ